MKKEGWMHTLLLTIGLLTLLLVIAQFFMAKGYINRAIENNEAMKVGGKENYEKLKELYKSDWFADAQEQQINAALSQGGGAQNAGQQATSPSQEEFPSGQINAAQIEQIKEGAYIEGNEDAKITIVEYSDPECPFCIRHHNDGTIKSVMDNYDGDVNHIVKAVQGVDHTNTESKSLAMLCAGDLGGAEAYYGMYDLIMGQSTPSTVVANSKIPEFAQQLGLNSSRFASCLEDKEFLADYQANWQEALSFQSSGTPGNLIINNETGEYRLVSGAYPTDTFIQIIDQWMK